MYLEIVLNEAQKNGWDKTLWFSSPGQAVGCSEEEIQNLESRLKLNLPLAYKEFLRYAGKGLGDFEIGSTIFYDDIDLVELQEIAKEFLIEDNAPFKLPDDAYVFWMHQGYMFCFFKTSEGDNPPVHFHIEVGEREEQEIKWNYQAHFTDFLITEMRDQVRHIENAKQTEDRIARDWTRG